MKASLNYVLKDDRLRKVKPLTWFEKHMLRMTFEGKIERAAHRLRRFHERFLYKRQQERNKGEALKETAREAIGAWKGKHGPAWEESYGSMYTW
jgi:hypothetical protein